MRFKKHLLRKQGIQELKATKIKEKNSLEAELLAILIAYLSPLVNFFTSNFSFSILPDIISNNILIPFL